MNKTFIALGSNLGDRVKFLTEAIKGLIELGELIKVSSLYESSAYGYTEQPAFLNAAALMNTAIRPESLLEQLQKLEQCLGRKIRNRWGPREIDLDIVFYNQQIIEQENLVIPHPDFHNRKFVLLPLMDLNPKFVSPTHQKTVAELLEICADKTPIKLIAREWYINGT